MLEVEGKDEDKINIVQYTRERGQHHSFRGISSEWIAVSAIKKISS
jgi:hypothetical protein